ncbi:MAG: OmpH family outer membrane protein [candidate division KSB1 bacterium]|nr:OmpH family outer membrane protein [candidate division KSB1 bacterium]
MYFKNVMKLLGIALMVLIFVLPAFSQNLKIGYVHSQKILATYKDALDVQKKLDEIGRQWENEGMEMQQKIQQLREQYEAQSLLLSDAKKKEKEQEIQTLILQLQKFQQDKFNPQTGEYYKKQAELLQPVYDKINAVIKKIGDDEKFSYIFDSAAGGIVHASADQPDLTDRVLAELNKGQATKTTSSEKNK